MKKILGLALLMVPVSSLYTMEMTITSTLLRNIESNLSSWVYIKKHFVSSDGEKIAVIDNTGVISVWDRTGNVIDRNLGQRINEETSLTFNQDATKLSIITSQGTEECDILNPDALKAIKDALNYCTIEKKVQSLDKTKIATLTNTGMISVWDGTGKLIEKVIAQANTKVTSLAFNQDATKLSVTTKQGTEEYDILNPDALKAIKDVLNYCLIEKKVQSLDKTKIAILANTGIISVWDGTGKVIDRKIAQRNAPVTSLAFNQDATKLSIGTKEGTEECDILNPDALKAINEAMSGSIIEKKIQSADKTKIAILTNAGNISVWDGISGKAINRFVAIDRYTVDSMTFTADGKAVITSSKNKKEEYRI